ncbi:translation initiation factor IF-2 [Pantanalinema sp. GBBB05]|uniref:translation initiation factor IF-2 n=1 Tax=Pantanalinema sp. GBBB05 TaxID=2604139 RepID=UPI001DC8F8AF|nr:translation initiation factor IF-2 [Pantanalinema sp. GBBB05]
MNSGKVRIYELSRELNLDNKDILAVCEQLNISVKSHSSTITDSEAERIRSAAEKYTAAHPTSVKPAAPRHGASHPTAESKPKVVPPVQKKQQILEIRKPSIRSVASPEPPTPPSYPSAPPAPPVTAPAVSQSAPVPQQPPVAPPNRPAQPVSSELPAPTEAVAIPEALSELELPFVEDNEPEVQLEPEVQEAPVVVEALSQPELVSPPQRPEAAPALSRSNLSNRPILKRARPEQSMQEEASAAQAKPSQGRDGADGGSRISQSPPRPVAAPNRQPSAPNRQQPAARQSDKPAPPSRPQQTIVELRRPRPVRSDAAPGAVEAKAAEGTGLKIGKKVDGDGIQPATSLIELQARPTLPRLSKKAKDWEEEEEGREFPGKVAAKAGAKTKRRIQTELDEDEDLDILLDEGEEEDADAPMQVSLSLVRPAKPKSMVRQSPVKSPAAAPITAKKKATSFRDRRDRREQEVKVEKPEKITLTGNLTVQELSNLMAIPETDIIRTLFFKGIAATITQTLDLATATMVAEELGVAVETGEKASEARKITEMLDAGDLESLQRRPPVVTIMGHVDHGKTTLLDSIRKTKVAQGEAGGITQHIGAYHVDMEHNGAVQQVVFLDTPGHEAFTAMRARGARVTDIAILVVAADDGVRPQTVEAISHAKAAEVPIIVAINKVDKEDSQPDRVKQELTEYGLVPEEWGGETIMVPVSALTGENLDTLLEMILLVAEVEELYANPDRPAKGTVIEAHLDKAKGPVATLLVQNGTLRVGDVLVAGSVFGKVRAMVDDRGDRVKEANPSFAVEVLGLGDVPAAGDEFDVFYDEKDARSVSASRTDEQRQSRLLQAMSSRRVSLNTLSARAQEGELKELNLVLKADVQGSVEAILGALRQLPQNEVQVRVLYAAPGEITETDVDLAAASDAVIIGFNTTLATGARQAADQAGVDVRDYNIIYKLLDDIQAAMEGLLEPELIEEALGQAEVRAVFAVGRGAVAGCYIQSGKIIRNCKIRIRRDGNVIYEGSLDSLKRMREDAKEVNAGYECGVGIDDFNDWAMGDIIEAYRMITKRRTLSPNK